MKGSPLGFDRRYFIIFGFWIHGCSSVRRVTTRQTAVTSVPGISAARTNTPYHRAGTVEHVTQERLAAAPAGTPQPLGETTG